LCTRVNLSRASRLRASWFGTQPFFGNKTPWAFSQSGIYELRQQGENMTYVGARQCFNCRRYGTAWFLV
jgi:hypothetical protein